MPEDFPPNNPQAETNETPSSRRMGVFPQQSKGTLHQRMSRFVWTLAISW